jgi:hypothetical protein
MLVTFALFAGVVVGCKQGEGERCQITDDCESGLTCNQATGLCVSNNMDNDPLDVLPPVDGPPVDVIDAPPDAPDAN